MFSSTSGTTLVIPRPLPPLKPNQLNHNSIAPIVDIAFTPSGHGYILVAADGGVFVFGDAPYFGSMGGIPLVGQIVAVVMGPNGGGYLLIAEDGGTFAFGNVGFHGSLGGLHLNAPIVDARLSPSRPSPDGYV